MLKKLFKYGFKSGNLDHRSAGFDALPDRLVDSVGTTIAELENKDAVLVFGTDLSDEEPMTFLRVRKGWFNNGTKVVVACDTETDSDSFAHTILRYKPGSEVAAAHAIAAAMDGKSADAEDLKASGLDAAAVEAAASALKGAGTAVLTTRSLLAKTGGADAASWLAKAADSQGGSFSLMATQANEQGALEIGFLPESGKNTREMLEAAKAGKLKALWLANYDPITDFPDVELAEAALENVEFLVVQAANETECAAYASVILPMTLPAEQDGTYTNVESRVQKMDQILQPVGEAKPIWRACSDALLRIDAANHPPFSASEVMAQICGEYPRFEAATADALSGEGALIYGPEIEPGQENQEPAGGQVQ
jgi:NADH-quinone oxidoreductase subunit G